MTKVNVLANYLSGLFVLALLCLTLVGCGDDGGQSLALQSQPSSGDPCAAGPDASQLASRAAAAIHYTPQGRVFVADQLGDTVSVIDVASNQRFNAISTGRGPHHVAVSPDNRELWVTLYGEKFLQVFCVSNGAPLAKIASDGQTDDLAFTPDGKYVFVSMGQDNKLLAVEASSYKVIEKIAVGKVPHGVRVRPDGKEVYVTSTSDNTVTAVEVATRKVVATIPVGAANPFELNFSPDGSRLYVSNFLGGSLSLIDTASHARQPQRGLWRTGNQPAMIWLDSKGSLYVACEGDGRVWVYNTVEGSGKPVDRITVGKQSHGIVAANNGNLYVTNVKDNSVTVIDGQSNKLLTTIAVGTAPNGLVYSAYAGKPQ